MDRSRMWRSRPGTGVGAHELVIAQDDRRVIRTVSFPNDPGREREVWTLDAADERLAGLWFDAWVRTVPVGYGETP